MTTTLLHQHPDGSGELSYRAGILTATNEAEDTVTQVLIGPAGLRDLASRLNALAGQIGGEA